MALNQIITLDFETGGLSPNKHPAMEIAYDAFELDSYKPILEFESFIQPYDNLEVTEGAFKTHGITLAQTMGGLDTKSLVKRLQEDFTKANTTNNFRSKPILLGHNITFDIGFLRYLFAKEKVDIAKYLDCNEDHLGNSVPKSICTMQLARQKWGNDPSVAKYNLGACCKAAGIEHFDAHRAKNDVKVTKELFFFFTNNLRTGSASSEETKGIRTRNHFKF